MSSGQCHSSLRGGGWGRFRVWSRSYFASLQIKRAVPAPDKQTPSPPATDEMTENKSNRKTSAPCRAEVQAPPAIAEIPLLLLFLLPSSAFFRLLGLALILLLKVTAAKNTKTLGAQMQRLFVWMKQSYSYRSGQMICHLSLSPPSLSLSLTRSGHQS